jgi:hypothetical protein
MHPAGAQIQSSTQRGVATQAKAATAKGVTAGTPPWVMTGKCHPGAGTDSFDWVTDSNRRSLRQNLPSAFDPAIVI